MNTLVQYKAVPLLRYYSQNITYTSIKNVLRKVSPFVVNNQPKSNIIVSF